MIAEYFEHVEEIEWAIEVLKEMNVPVAANMCINSDGDLHGVAAYLAGTVVIGLWVNRYIKGMGDFLVAGRSLRTRLGIATMIGSELGLVTAMFAAQKGFTTGFSAFHIGLMAGIATLIVGVTGDRKSVV